MGKFLLVSEDSQITTDLVSILKSHNFPCVTETNEQKILNQILKNEEYDLILLDIGIKNIDLISFANKIKLNNNLKNIPIILIIPQNYEKVSELFTLANAIITYPCNKIVLISTIKSNLQTKNSLDILSKSNTELSKSLYQLDVLYNISTKLAGSLDKYNLLTTMIDGVEKSLSFDLAYTFVCDDKNNLTLIINSLCPLTERFEQAIKLRALLNYKSMLDKDDSGQNITTKSIKVRKNIKQEYNEFDLNVFRFDSLFTKINSGEKFYGLIEVFRKNEFSQEDLTCFQTLSKQVSIPLEGASLYEELKETNTKLQKLERLKSEFISIVSHELRTPLTALKNCLDIINSQKAGKTTDAMNKFLDMAKRNVIRLSGIINDLLDLSKIEAGKMEFRYEISNISNTIELVINNLENLANEKGIKIEKELISENPDVYIDPQRIEQVLTNLLSNAIKFTPDNGKITITSEIISSDVIRTKNLIQQKEINTNCDYIKISVKDTGIGISKEDTEKIFDKFQQIENSLNRKNGGTGLGIPIAKQLMEAHNGFIWVESELNKGSEFTIAIPVATDDNIFKIDLLNAISKAKINHSNISIIKITEDNTSEINIIDNILKNSNDIIKKTNTSKELVIETDTHKEYYIFIPEADEFFMNFTLKKIDTYLKENNVNNDIIQYFQAIYPDDGITVEDLYNKLNKPVNNYSYMQQY